MPPSTVAANANRKRGGREGRFHQFEVYLQLLAEYQSTRFDDMTYDEIRIENAKLHRLHSPHRCARKTKPIATRHFFSIYLSDYIDRLYQSDSGKSSETRAEPGTRERNQKDTVWISSRPASKHSIFIVCSFFMSSRWFAGCNVGRAKLDGRP